MDIIFLDNLPLNTKDRIIGIEYIDKKGNIVIWTGKILHCEHNRRKRYCKECGGSQICEHNRERNTCKECGGSQICEHGTRKSHCKKCKGTSVCEHNIIRQRCKECGGTSICKHGREKYSCKECQGSQICEHNKRKQKCKECKGSSICKHDKQRTICKECRGSQICEHNKQKGTCKQCGGRQICEHDKQKSKCKNCKGSEICEHNTRKECCHICFTHPQNFCVNCKQTYVKRSPYYPYCFPCYCNLNPEEEIPKRYMSKEIYIRKYLKENLNIDMKCNKKIDGGCSRKKPDGFIDCLTHSVIWECDENKHKGYNKECDNKRTMELFQDLGNRPLVFIRFNPDEIKDHESCFIFDKQNKILPTKEWEIRKLKLLQTIRFHVDNIPEKEITIEYLYYD